MEHKERGRSLKYSFCHLHNLIDQLYYIVSTYKNLHSIEVWAIKKQYIHKMSVVEIRMLR